MKKNYFDDKAQEYVIEDMYPLRPLLNYIWNEEYIMGVDHTGQGKGFASVGDGLRRDLFLPDCDNRLIYIRDEENGDYACMNKPFSRKKLEDYRCHVAVGSQRIVSRYCGISMELTLTVPEKGRAELWRLKICNESAKERSLSVFAYAKVHVNETPHCSYNLCNWDEIVGGLYFSHAFHSIDSVEHPFKSVYLCADTPVTSYCTSETRFRGHYQTYEHPAALEKVSLDCCGSSYDEYPAAAVQFGLKLAAGEQKTIYLTAGVASGRTFANAEAARMLKKGFFETTLNNREKEANRVQNVYHLESGDPYIDRLTNVWLKNQVQLGKTWARVYGKGVRDMLQDVTAFISMDVELAREKILNILSYQFANGNTIRMFAPFSRHPYMDGAAWIPETVLMYIKETADFDLLNQVVPFFESEESGSVLEHIRRGIHFLMNHLGSHGLCLWGGGDWNDSINNAGLQGIGESVWLSIAAVKAAKQYAQILSLIGEEKEAKTVLCQAENMTEKIVRHGWEKDHFIYGINDWGEKVGSDDCREGKIYLNPQTWAVLAGIFDSKRCAELMDTVEQRLHCDYGYVQCSSAYTQMDNHIGRSAAFVPGSCENASVYNHGVAFKIAADCLLGRAEEAYRSIREILPDNPVLKNSGVEPYAMTNMYLGPENPYEATFAPCSWITGTAGWMYRCITEFLFGVRAEYNGLRIAPCLPSQFRNVKIIRQFRGAVYQISINRTGVRKMLCDGAEIKGDLVPVFETGSVHYVEVSLE